jgi:hypothetical protein
MCEIEYQLNLISFGKRTRLVNFLVKILDKHPIKRLYDP